MIQAQWDAHRGTVESSLKGKKQGGGALEGPNNDALTASCLVLQKGRGQGLYDLLADESFEKGIKECLTRGKYQRQLFERDLLWQKNGASVFSGEGWGGAMQQIWYGVEIISGKMNTTRCVF